MSLGIRHRVWALAALVLGLFPLSAAASHFRYGALSWASTGNPGEVEFRLTASYERDAYPGSGPDGFPVTGDVFQEQQGPTSLAFDGAAGINGDFTQPLFFRVTAHSISEGWIVGQALDPVTGAVGVRHTYAGPGPFVAYLAGIGTGTPPVQFPGCCRIGQPGFPSTTDLANRAGLPYPLQTLVFPQSGNSSPVTTMVPIVVVPPSAAATFQIPALDPDGDSIQFRLSTDAEAGGPQHPPGLSVNAATGTVTWNNLTSGPGGTPLDQTKFWTTQIVIEDLDINGQVKTKTPVDFLLLIKPVTQNLPSCAISPAGPLTAPAGNPFSFLVTGTDVDPGDTVTLNTGGIPGGATLTPALPVTGSSPQSTQFAWTPTLADVGAHAVIFSATDTSGQQGLCQTTILVVDNASAPSCAISAHPSTVLAGTAVSFTVTGTDPGDTLTLDSSTVPAGATMTPPLPITNVPSPVTSQFNWTPGVGDVGSHPISFTVTDSANLVSTCNTTIQVVANASPPTCTINPPSQLNQPLTPTGGAGARIGGVLYASSAPGPRIGGVLYAPPTVQAGTPVSFTVTGTDPDLGDLLDLDLTSGALPTGAALTPPLPVTDVPSPVVTVLDWTPTVAQAGVHSFSFQVTDAAGQQGTCQATVTVTNPNPPSCVIVPAGPQTLPAGTPVGFTVTGTDPDQGDLLDLDLTSGALPSGATLTPSLPIIDASSPVPTVFSWTPTAAQAGGRTFSFRVTDAGGQQATCQTTVTVTNPNPPRCTINPAGPQTVPSGTPVAFTVTGSDPDLGDLLGLALTSGALPAGATLTPALPISGALSPVSSQFKWTPSAAQAGSSTFSFLVTDAVGQQAACQTSVTVLANVPPTITCPGPLAFEGCNASGGQRATLKVHVEDANGDPLTVTWEVDGVVVQVDHVPAPGGGGVTSADVTLTRVFGLGTHTVRVSVSDGQATAVSCTTTVSVVDRTRPVVSCSAQDTMLWPPNHNLINVGFDGSAVDACDANVSGGARVFADEDDEDQTGDGHHSPDAKNIASGTLRLRSERKGDANGRVYLILATGTDDSGNTGRRCCAVTVPHSQSRAAIDSVIAQANAAVATCEATGAPPAGFFVVGDGPVLGPKQ